MGGHINQNIQSPEFLLDGRDDAFDFRRLRKISLQ